MSQKSPKLHRSVMILQDRKTIKFEAGLKKITEL